jgi:hypothetical protein
MVLVVQEVSRTGSTSSKMLRIAGYIMVVVLLLLVAAVIAVWRW